MTYRPYLRGACEYVRNCPILGSLTHWFAATTMETMKPPLDYLRLDTSWGDACVHLDMLSLVFESSI